MDSKKDDNAERPRPKVADLPQDLRPEELTGPQLTIYNDPSRIRVAACGRRFGKTRLGEVEAAMATVAKPKALVWWVSAAQGQAQRSWRLMQMHFEYKAWTKKEQCQKYKRLHLHNDSAIEFLTAGSGDRLRGAGLDFLVVDEAADVPEAMWTSVLRPALMDRQGRALVLGTPRGRGNWLHRLWHQGQQAEYEGVVKSFHFTTLQGGRVLEKEVQAAKRLMNAQEFKQEIEAEFVYSAGRVFSDVKDLVIDPPPGESSADAPYVSGLDIGRRNDATVLITLRVCGREPARMAGCLRLERMSWREQEERIVEHLKGFAGYVLADATGMGDPFVEQLQMRVPNVEGLVFTEHRKAALICDLQMALSGKALRLTNVPELLDELEQFEFQEQAPGRLRHFPRYGAPAGHHDDCVIALALAWHALKLHYPSPLADEAGVGVRRMFLRNGLFG